MKKGHTTPHIRSPKLHHSVSLPWDLRPLKTPTFFYFMAGKESQHIWLLSERNMPQSLVVASCCCGKTHWKKQLKKGRILDSPVKNAVCLGEEGMAAGIWGSCFHVFLRSGRERGNASSTQFFFSFLCNPGGGVAGNETSKDRQAFSLQLAPSAGGSVQMNGLLS